MSSEDIEQQRQTPNICLGKYEFSSAVLGISPFFNLRSMKNERKDRAPRYIQGLLHSSPNYTTDDHVSSCISRALFQGKLTEKHLEESLLSALTTPNIFLEGESSRTHLGKLKRTCDQNLALDVHEALIHCAFTGVEKDITNQKLNDIVQNNRVFFAVKNISREYAQDLSWPKYEQVIFYGPIFNMIKNKELIKKIIFWN